VYNTEYKIIFVTLCELLHNYLFFNKISKGR